MGLMLDVAAGILIAAAIIGVVRFGFMKKVGEFPYDGKVKPGCGSKQSARLKTLMLRFS